METQLETSAGRDRGSGGKGQPDGVVKVRGPVGVRHAWWLLVAGLGLWLLWQTAAVWLAAFLAVAFTVAVVGLAQKLERHWPLGYGPSLAAVGLAILTLIAAAGLWTGPALVTQFDELSQQLPKAVAAARDWLQQQSWGPTVLDRLADAEASLGDRSVMNRVGAWLSTAAGAAGGGLAVLAITAFLAARPGLYVAGVKQLLPPRHERRTDQVLHRLASALRWWTLGQLASMLVTGTLTGLGLWIIGVPLAWVLGLLAGLLAFVPNLGSLAGMALGVLVASTESPSLVLWTAGVYVAVQLIESNLITPMIQQYVVSVPPALLLTFQIAMGLLFGVLGLLVSTPLLVAVMVVVQMLWVRDHLGREVKVLGEEK